MNTKQYILETIMKRPLIIDGAMGTQLQQRGENIPKEAWEGNEGCNELLNVTCPEVLSEIFEAYLTSGADFITTNTFGSFSWVLDEYDIGHRAYELTKAGIVGTISYSNIVFAVVIGVMLGDPIPDFWTVLGIILVIMSGLLVALPKKS